MYLLKVKPYDLVRVIESFIRAEKTLPTLLKLHMSHVEERLLEQLMWKSGSPVFPLLEKVRLCCGSCCCPFVVCMLGFVFRVVWVVGCGLWVMGCVWRGPLRSLSFVPCRQEKRAAAQGAAHGPQSIHLQVARKKLERLAAQRVEGVTELLELDGDLANEIWTTTKQALADPNVLLRDRHLDQVVICSVYAVCKVHNRPMTFLRIIQKMQRIVGQLTRVRTHGCVFACGVGVMGVGWIPCAVVCVVFCFSGFRLVSRRCEWWP